MSVMPLGLEMGGFGGFGGTGAAGGVSGVGRNNRSDLRDNIQDTISRLEQERDKYKKQQEDNNSDLLNKRIKNLEDRINNLQNRLGKLKAEENDGECETCKNRKYQDESDDPGVSFKNASKIAPGAVEAAVRGHEQEHVTRNQAKADREGREIVYQSVVIKHAICPECGKSYVSGGETTTVTRNKPVEEKFNVGLQDPNAQSGALLNVVA